MSTNKSHFWLRHEIKPNEGRTPILPEHAKTLLQAGHSVTVERSKTRCVKDEEYDKVGCTLVESETWEESPKGTKILGLKELQENDKAIERDQIYFAHCFKGQGGDVELLTRFKKGGAKLWDLEFLTDEQGRRVAAFGRAAGIAGMAVGLITWVYQQLNPSAEEPVPALTEQLANYDALADYVKKLLDQAKEKTNRLPRVIVIGALGRCGGGSCDFATRVGVEVTRWDLEETKKGGPFVELLDHDIFLNAIYLMHKIPPFLDFATLNGRADRKLSVVVDVSCDTSNPNNPIPIYNQTTTFLKPTVRVVKGEKPVDVIAIDHLPSLVPYESSKEFGDALIPHLTQFPDTPVWNRAEKLFEEKLKEKLSNN